MLRGWIGIAGCDQSLKVSEARFCTLRIAASHLCVRRGHDTLAHPQPAYVLETRSLAINIPEEITLGPVAS